MKSAPVPHDDQRHVPVRRGASAKSREAYPRARETSWKCSLHRSVNDRISTLRRSVSHADPKGAAYFWSNRIWALQFTIRPGGVWSTVPALRRRPHLREGEARALPRSLHRPQDEETCPSPLSSTERDAELTRRFSAPATLSRRPGEGRQPGSSHMAHRKQEAAVPHSLSSTVALNNLARAASSSASERPRRHSPSPRSGRGGHAPFEKTVHDEDDSRRPRRRVLARCGTCHPPRSSRT